MPLTNFMMFPLTHKHLLLSLIKKKKKNFTDSLKKIHK